MNGIAVTRFTTGTSMKANSQARKKTMIRSPKSEKIRPKKPRTMNPSAIAPRTRMASNQARSRGVSSKPISPASSSAPGLSETHLLADLGHRRGRLRGEAGRAGLEDLVDHRRLRLELEVALPGAGA